MKKRFTKLYVSEVKRYAHAIILRIKLVLFSKSVKSVSDRTEVSVKHFYIVDGKE